MPAATLCQLLVLAYTYIICSILAGPRISWHLYMSGHICYNEPYSKLVGTYIQHAIYQNN